jgi:cell division protein FtsI (penicillin-binding protein 3)
MRVIDRRTGWLFLIFVVLLAVALSRALWLGAVQSGHLKTAAYDEQVNSEPVPADRGEITDSSGVPLALSEPVDDLVADPYVIARDGDAPAMARRIAPLLHISSATVLGDLTDIKRGGYSPIVTQASPSVASKVLNLTVGGKPINGVYTEPDTKRVYPRAWDLSQVLGYVDNLGSGVAGLEYRFNTQLSGVAGERKVIDNPSTGDPISIQTVRKVTPGKSLRLTISAPLQDEVEQVLAGVGKEYSPKFATAIVMRPSDGAILALGNWPRVDANDPYAGGTTTQIDNAIQDHAVSFNYEPGSTFKAVTVAGALQDGLITPSTQFAVPSALQTPYGTVINDAEPHGDETLTTAQILKVSSNIGADLIGEKLGPDRFNYWVHRFGLGAATGVDLPGEQPGLILQPRDYSGTSMYNLPFGQGESVTPIQMADVYSAIANGGILRTPHVVQSIGGTATSPPPGHRIISASTASELRNMLRGVLADGGTASGAAIPGYDLAGKTGTAQVAVDGHYSKSEFVASFIGMVPANAPKLIVSIVVDEPQGDSYGGSVAGPAFQKIVGWAVPYFGINPNPAHVGPEQP